jgi:hypothetical protein
VARVERDDIDDEIEAVRDGKRPSLVAIELNVLVLGVVTLGFPGERQLPAVARKRTGDR